MTMFGFVPAFSLNKHFSRKQGVFLPSFLIGQFVYIKRVDLLLLWHRMESFNPRLGQFRIEGRLMASKHRLFQQISNSSALKRCSLKHYDFFFNPSGGVFFIGV